MCAHFEVACFMSSVLCRGNLAGMWLWVVYSAVQFPIYDDLKRSTAQWVDSKPLQGVISGAIAAGVASIASHPFDVVRTVLAGQGEPKVRDTSHTHADVALLWVVESPLLFSVASCEIANFRVCAAVVRGNRRCCAETWHHWSVPRSDTISGSSHPLHGPECKRCQCVAVCWCANPAVVEACCACGPMK